MRSRSDLSYERKPVICHTNRDGQQDPYSENFWRSMAAPRQLVILHHPDRGCLRLKKRSAAQKTVDPKSQWGECDHT